MSIAMEKNIKINTASVFLLLFLCESLVFRVFHLLFYWYKVSFGPLPSMQSHPDSAHQSYINDLISIWLRFRECHKYFRCPDDPSCIFNFKTIFSAHYYIIRTGVCEIILQKANLLNWKSNRSQFHHLSKEKLILMKTRSVKRTDIP